MRFQTLKFKQTNFSSRTFGSNIQIKHFKPNIQAKHFNGKQWKWISQALMKWGLRGYQAGIGLKVFSRTIDNSRSRRTSLWSPCAFSLGLWRFENCRFKSKVIGGWKSRSVKRDQPMFGDGIRWYSEMVLDDGSVMIFDDGVRWWCSKMIFDV